MSGNKLPEFVYLITVDGEWPVSALAADHPSIADWVEREVERRKKSENVWRPDQVKVWKVAVRDAERVELMPTTTVHASLRPAETGDAT